MTTTPAPKASRLVTIRIEVTVREQLDNLAAASDRALAQLVRYALTSYFEMDRGCPSTRAVTEENVTRHTAFRLPDTLIVKVEAKASQYNVTTSDVIREAITLWLTNGTHDMLGSPITENAEVN